MKGNKQRSAIVKMKRTIMGGVRLRRRAPSSNATGGERDRGSCCESSVVSLGGSTFWSSSRSSARPRSRCPRAGSGEAAASAPKSQPKAPKLDVGQEAIKAAFEGHGRLMVSVSRSADILECVKLCNSYGIKPVLVSGSGAGAVAAQLKGKVTGVLVSSLTTARSLSQAGVPVAFGSGAEEGAADLPGYVASGIRSGLSPAVVVRSLTGDAADILGVNDRVGRIAPGMDGDILFLGASPLSGAPQVARTWVAGKEIK